MDEDVQAVPGTNLEISVPSIVVPTSRERDRLRSEDGIDEARSSMVETSPVDTSEVIEQVRILPAGARRSTSLLQRHEQTEVIVGKASPQKHQKGKRRFRIFHIQGLPAQGQALLLQILRPGRKAIRKPQEQARPTDELTFSVEFRRLDEPSETAQGEPEMTELPEQPAPILTPGLNRVVIFLDKEGTPCSYSIDGAEG